MTESDWRRVDAYIARPADPGRPGARRGARRRTRPPGCRRSRSRRPRASSCTSSPGSPAPGASSRSARSAATRRSGSPARCPPDGRLVTLEAEPAPCRGGPRPTSPAPASPTGSRSASGRGARHRCPGSTGPLRPRLHRRRQAQQPRLPRLGAPAFAPRHGDRLRQRRPRRPDRRPGAATTRDVDRHPRASSTGSRPSRGWTPPRCRPSAPRAGTASPSPSFADVSVGLTSRGRAPAALLRQRDELGVVPRRQLEAAVLPVAGPPGLLGRLDPLLRRGDEVPPDVARPAQRLAAEQHQPRPVRPGGDVQPVARAGTPSSAPPRSSGRRSTMLPETT